MNSRTTILAFALLAMGTALGYALANGALKPMSDATAALQVEASGESPAPAPSSDAAAIDAAIAAPTTPVAFQPAQAQGKRPNILVIFGDDIGIANVSCYSDGVMGYETLNIDRLAKEGVRFLHYYGEQSCTAGRAAFLTGQHGLRTGLTKVGYPGAPMGMSQLDPSIGGLLKNLG